VVGGKAEAMVWRTEMLSAQAATISDRDRSAFRSSDDHFRPGQKCFPLKRRPFRTRTKVLSAQAATISDWDRNAFRLSGNHFGPEKHTIRHTWKLITDLSETETAQP